MQRIHQIVVLFVLLTLILRPSFHRVPLLLIIFLLIIIYLKLALVKLILRIDADGLIV